MSSDNTLTVVHFTESSLAQIIASGLEAYVVPHEKEENTWTGIETFMTLWGSETQADGNHCFNVQFAIPSTSAMRDYDGVTPSPSMYVKQDIMSAYFPQYQMIGDLHTHPWIRGRSSGISAARIRKEGLYELSMPDIEASTGCAWDKQHQGYRIAAVFTLIDMEKENTAKDGPIGTNTIEFSLNNYKCWLTVVAFDFKSLDELSAQDKEFAQAYPDCIDQGMAMILNSDVIMHAPLLYTLFEHQQFGSVTGKRKLRHIKG